MKLLDGLYWYPFRGFENNANTCIFDGEIRALVDPGHLFNLKNLMRSIEADGLEARKLDLIILSHCHPDHCEATPKLKEVSKAKVAIHEIEARYLKEYGPIYRIPEFSADFYLGSHLDLGGIKIEILHMPGHTPGSVCLYWRKQKVLFSSDVVFFMGVGRADLPGGDAAELQRSISKLSKLEVEYLLPGHHYNFPPNHPGFIKGSENVKKNFSYLRSCFE